MYLKERLKEFRLKAKLTQTEASEILKVKQNTLSRWENGEREPDYETLIAICSVYNTTPNQLLLSDQEQGTPCTADTPILTDEERQLLEKFRQLDEENKKAAINNIDGLLLLQKSKNTPVYIPPVPAPTYSVPMAFRSRGNKEPMRITQMTEAEQRKAAELFEDEDKKE